MLDLVVDRRETKAALARALRFMSRSAEAQIPARCADQALAAIHPHA